ncbi:MAG: ferrous iron transport protein A [Thermoanaerobacteraceae bacterium]|uniref:FeoA family protein n=1 Tax=Thermanaeromonas sp. C210 TaxID=2731925 RepID=UPI00155B8854|nr:ferrous iron transport protein A [Thermanaeromonas sp. C210]MBE3582184.1 ferrous iron transport protein A [Thermoanaerobacteraceae bacterium]GFN23618.1 iron transporter [Thermanaeromonas sp. C210]
MTLDQAKKGHLYRVTQLPGKEIRSQAIRFGLWEGAVVTCKEVIPRGPVIVGRNHQEIAIGRGLARRIHIEPVVAYQKVS